MLPKILAAVAIAAVTAAAFSSPADAARRARHYYHPHYYASSQGASLDGRVTGRPRTCWSDTYVRDNRGVPVGPYCH
jgi:hypothetical protein